MIELTDEAISAAIKKTNDYGRDAIRLGVSSGGCAGYEYIIEFADTIAEDDHILDYGKFTIVINPCLLYTSPSPRDRQKSRMPSSA